MLETLALLFVAMYSLAMFLLIRAKYAVVFDQMIFAAVWRPRPRAAKPAAACFLLENDNA